MTDQNPDGVVLLHGILRSKRSMRSLEKFLRAQGYRTLNLGYPSTRHDIPALAALVRPQIEAFAATVPGRLHIVAHSMGSLITRLLLAQSKPGNLGRVVMLGPPNQGSEVADKLRHLWLFKKIYGPAGQQLVTGANLLADTIDYELGIVAGSRPLDPICSYLISQPNDGKVSVAGTRLDGMADHVTVKTDHSLMLLHKQIRQLVLNFLRSGRFH